MGFLERLKDGLSKTRRNFTDRIEELVGMSAKVDEDFLEELEMILLSGDVGVKTTEKLIDAVRQAAKKKEIEGTEQVMPFLKKYIAEMLQDEGQRTRIGAKPTVILVVGVNGVGKTTTIGKLANYFHLFKYKVMLAAGDTFRAAASEQLEIWAKRAGVPIVSAGEGADPAAVIFDTVKSATARGYDMVIADTAGRLHNKANLMNELAKIDRVISRELPDASRETLLVLDAKTPRENLNFTGYTCLEYDILYRGYTGPLDVGSSVIFDNIGSYSNVLKPPFIHPDVPMIEYRKGDDSLRLIKRAQTAEEIFAQYVFEE